MQAWLRLLDPSPGFGHLFLGDQQKPGLRWLKGANPSPVHCTGQKLERKHMHTHMHAKKLRRALSKGCFRKFCQFSSCVTLETDHIPGTGTPEMVSKHFILVTVLLQFESSRIIRLVQLVTSLELHGNLSCLPGNADHEVWQIFQYTSSPTDFRILNENC